MVSSTWPSSTSVLPNTIWRFSDMSGLESVTVLSHATSYTSTTHTTWLALTRCTECGVHGMNRVMRTSDESMTIWSAHPTNSCIWSSTVLRLTARNFVV